MAPPDYSDLMSIKDQVCLVTGASSGIGSRFAVFLATQGAKVVLAARREEKLQDLVEVKQDAVSMRTCCSLSDWFHSKLNWG